MNIDWQLYWKKWHLGKEKHYWEEFNIYNNYLFIGPLQIKWYSSK